MPQRRSHPRQLAGRTHQAVRRRTSRPSSHRTSRPTPGSGSPRARSRGASGSRTGARAGDRRRQQPRRVPRRPPRRRPPRPRARHRAVLPHPAQGQGAVGDPGHRRLAGPHRTHVPGRRRLLRRRRVRLRQRRVRLPARPRRLPAPPDRLGRRDRGELRLVYAYAHMRDGAMSKVVVLNRADIDQIKDVLAGLRLRLLAVDAAEDSMWLKSAVRQSRSGCRRRPSTATSCAGRRRGPARTSRGRAAQVRRAAAPARRH